MKKLSKVLELSTKGELLVSSECKVSKGNEKFLILSDPIKVVALWDTGASFCHISPAIAKKLNLVSLGKESIINKDGKFQRNLFIINVHFLENWIETVVAFESDCDTNQLLIGMDLISRGDFIIKKVGTKLVFSFEVKN